MYWVTIDVYESLKICYTIDTYDLRYLNSKNKTYDIFLYQSQIFICDFYNINFVRREIRFSFKSASRVIKTLESQRHYKIKMLRKFRCWWFRTKTDIWPQWFLWSRPPPRSHHFHSPAVRPLWPRSTSSSSRGFSETLKMVNVSDLGFHKMLINIC